MLPAINRIKKKKDFEVIFKNSKSFKNNLFIFKIMKNNLGVDRFGFVVSQKISKRATIRNKVKRRLAEAVSFETKKTFAGGKIKNGTDLVFITLSGIEKKDFSEIKEAVTVALAKSKLL